MSNDNPFSIEVKPVPGEGARQGEGRDPRGVQVSPDYGELCRGGSKEKNDRNVGKVPRDTT